MPRDRAIKCLTSHETRETSLNEKLKANQLRMRRISTVPATFQCEESTLEREEKSKTSSWKIFWTHLKGQEPLEEDINLVWKVVPHIHHHLYMKTGIGTRMGTRRVRRSSGVLDLLSFQRGENKNDDSLPLHGGMERSRLRPDLSDL